MNSFELNKILGALLGTCLILLALSIGAGAIFSPDKPGKPGFEIAVKEAAPGGGAGEKKEPSQPIEALLASASVEKGQATAKQCQACHTFEKGGPNRVGPNLWNIVNDKRGEDRGGFNFSAAMKAKGGTWTYEELDKFLTNPRGYIPGTNMTFAGLTRDQQRADVIAYLRTLADNPAPLPKAAEAKPAGDQAAPASGSQGGGQPAAKPAAPQPANAGAQPNAQKGQAPPKQ
jgi:cytochrome c